MLDNPSIEKQFPQKVSMNNGKSKQDRPFRKPGMYSSVIIENFRLFDHLELDDLSRVNLFFGPNNSGKTSVLEAVFTHACGLNFVPFHDQIFLRRCADLLTGPLDFGEKIISVFRDKSSLPYTFTISAKLTGDPSVYTLISTFHPSPELADLNPRALGRFPESFPSEPQTSSQVYVDQPQISQSTHVQPTFLGKWKTQLDGKKFELDLTFPLPGMTSASHFKLGYMNDLLSHRHPNSEIKVFAQLKRYEILDEFIKEMGSAFPGIRKIDMIPYPDGKQGPVYVGIGDRWLPLFVFGDGMRRWFHLLGHMLVNKNALHCIEEIDSSFHPDAHCDLSRLLIRYAEKFENQLFLTSHSIEFADAFLEALYGEGGILVSSSEDPIRVFTIRFSEDHERLEIWKLTGREAYKNRSYYNLELR